MHVLLQLVVSLLVIDFGVISAVTTTSANEEQSTTMRDPEEGQVAEPLIFRDWNVPSRPQAFDFDAVFGDNMVLQRGPSSRAAIYGFLGNNESCRDVRVTVWNRETNARDVYMDAFINVTQQPFSPSSGGGEYGIRPCSKHDCPPYDMPSFNPWNHYLPSWKVLLKPMYRGGGNYTITAECTSHRHDGSQLSSSSQSSSSSSSLIVQRRTITNVTFGDVWYCSGQSNMWLPLKYTFERNATIDAIVTPRDKKKYHNIRIMAGSSSNVPYGKGGTTFNPGYGKRDGSNPWMTAFQAVESNRFLDFGATCWYFAQRLVDEFDNNDDHNNTPIVIGLVNTAIGGQRIEEFVTNSSLHKCSNRTGRDIPWWDAELYVRQVLPFVDMTIKGWIWYQGEANMASNCVKGNSIAHVGYGCEIQQLVEGWRMAWSSVQNTTHPLAPFGIVTLASSAGSNHLGTMRHAQTANYGIVPNPALPNTFVAQAYDLDDEWGPDAGPCLASPSAGSCCPTKDRYNTTTCNATLRAKCRPACEAAANTPNRGGIHPRNKKYVGDRLGTAAFNTVYGGPNAFTGPTLAGCRIVHHHRYHSAAVDVGVDVGERRGSTQRRREMEIFFNSTLLRGSALVVQHIPPLVDNLPHGRTAGGSQLYVQTDPNSFCMEPIPCSDDDDTSSWSTKECCPSWAGGDTREQHNSNMTTTTTLDGGWIMVNFSIASNTSIKVDLSPLPQDVMPSAVRYAWGVVDCCDHTDPDLYVTHGCIANCPIVACNHGVRRRRGSSSGSDCLPANPFQARIVNGQCECVAPQDCGYTTFDDNVVGDVTVQ